jgi:anti-sigma regulatory factor (Ser/Thr protein kinase)
VEYVHRSWLADAREAAAIRRAVRTWLEPLALGANEVDDLILAVYEAVANVVEHAYDPGEKGLVELVLWTEPNVLCIEVIDHGTWRPPPADATFRGRGIQLMHAIADSVAIHYDQRGTRVLLRRALLT